MAIVKNITVGGREVAMRASALTPRFYRMKFGRDITRDFRKLRDDMKQVSEDQDKCLDVIDLTIFEDIAYIMAWHADNSIPSDPDEWLDSFDGVFSIYEAFPQIMEMWQLNNVTTSIPRKK